jgi:hypothetical protein
MPEPKRDLGEQPLARLLDDAGLGAPQLVDASTDGLTHKQVQRARKGRRLTANVMGKVWISSDRPQGVVDCRPLLADSPAGPVGSRTQYCQ